MAAPLTTTIPETVTLPGDALLDAFAEAYWLGEWDSAVNFEDTPTREIDHATGGIMGLFWPAFHGKTFRQAVEDGWRAKDDPLYLEVVARSNAIRDDWLARLQTWRERSDNDPELHDA